MAPRPALTATIITLNEEKNIARCLESLAWADEIIVVDSGSSDTTCEIAQEMGAKVLQNNWDGYGQQKNFAMEKASGPWVLNVDADEVVSEDLHQEIINFLDTNDARHMGAMLPRKTWYLGKWIRFGGWYPNYLARLVLKGKGRWTEPAVHESLQVEGELVKFKGDLLHYSFPSVGDQVATNIRFARLGAKVAKDRGERGTLLKILLKPISKFLESYLWKLGFLDGFPGFVISVNAAHSVFMKYVGLRFEENSRN